MNTQMNVWLLGKHRIVCAAVLPPVVMTHTGERRGRRFCPGIHCAPNV